MDDPLAFIQLKHNSFSRSTLKTVPKKTGGGFQIQEEKEVEGFLKCGAVIINLDVQFGSETFSGANPIQLCKSVKLQGKIFSNKLDRLLARKILT